MQNCVAPDGGWGWVVCVASFAANLVVDGTMFSFGVLLLALLDDLRGSLAATAWAGSAQLGMSMAMGQCKVNHSYQRKFENSNKGKSLSLTCVSKKHSA